MNLERIKNQQQNLNEQLNQLLSENNQLVTRITGDFLQVYPENAKVEQPDSLIGEICELQANTFSLINKLFTACNRLGEFTYEQTETECVKQMPA